MSALDPVVVDTDAYTLLFIRRDSADPRVPEWRARLAGRRVLASFQTRAEVLALSSVNMWGDRRAGELRAQLDRTPMIGLDESVVEAYATLVGQCRRAGHPLHQKQHTADRWVAACAIAKGIRLLSGDNIFERTPGLPLLREQTMSDSRRLVSKLVAGSNVLRDAGVNMYEYTEQLTYLLFLKMAEERATRRLNPERVVPDEFSWHELLGLSGEVLEDTYNHILRGLASQPGVLGAVYRGAQNKISNPSHLKTLIVDYIDKENWSAAGADVNGDAYEELLERSAGDTKSTAGQYFTPRALIQAVVEVVQPAIDDRVVDPACGTGGFLLAAHAHVSRDAAGFTPPQREHLRTRFVTGVDIGATTSRLASMNLLLHGLGSISGDALIAQKDALIADPGDRYSVVLANPPFGRSSSTDIGGGDDDGAEIFRQDFVVTTSNKQLNFLQHILTILDINGRAAVVLPDNVLFEGGAGETLRRKLLTAFDFHTLLRLPTGIFYKPGVKANVLFFDRKPAAEQPWTQRLWVYDLRTNKHFTLKKNPLRRDDLDDFVSSYLPGKARDERTESERWRSFTYNELIARDKVNLDITWLRDESLEDADNLPAPEVIAREIVEDLTAALAEFEAVAAALEARAAGSDLPDEPGSTGL